MIICVKLSVQLAGDLAIIIQRTGVSLLCLFLSFLSCLIKLPRLWWHVKERENEKIPGATFHLCKNFVQIFDVEHGALWEKGRLKNLLPPRAACLGMLCSGVSLRQRPGSNDVVSFLQLSTPTKWPMTKVRCPQSVAFIPGIPTAPPPFTWAAHLRRQAPAR